MRFTDRADAGRQLADRLVEYEPYDAVVYALPRGGVPVAAAVAEHLGKPLELVIARKIGHPFDPEYAVGAVTEDGPAIWNETLVGNFDSVWMKQAEAAERTEARRRRETYLGDREPVSATGKTAILIDDGMATGLSMQAAAEAIRKQKPEKVIIAVPCGPADAVSELLEHADDCIVLADPEEYEGAVGFYYDHFPQLTDEEVTDLLDEFGG